MSQTASLTGEAGHLVDEGLGESFLLVVLLDGPVVVLNDLSVEDEAVFIHDRLYSVSHTHLLLGAMAYLFDATLVDPMDYLLEYLSEQTVTEVTLYEDAVDLVLLSQDSQWVEDCLFIIATLEATTAENVGVTVEMGCNSIASLISTST